MRRTGLQADAGSRSGPLRRPRAAFSIVELMIVVGILSLLVATLVPVVREALIRAEVTQCIAIVGKLSGGCEMYKAETGYYPGQRDISEIGGDNTGSKHLAETLFDPGEKWSLTAETDDRLPDGGVSDRFSDPMPVLYFPAKLGVRGLGQYNVDHNIKHIQDYTEASETVIRDAFEDFITDTRVDPGDDGSDAEPYNPKGYLIIAAGKNRQYLDSDDVTSFSKKK